MIFLYLKGIFNPGYVKKLSAEDYEYIKDYPEMKEIILSSIDTTNKDINLRELYGDKFKDGRVIADWCTELIRFVEGEQLQYVHLGFYSLYEIENVLKIEKGKVIEWEKYSNDLKEIPDNYSVKDLWNEILLLPKDTQHCYFLKKSRSLIDTICYFNQDESLSLIGHREFFEIQKSHTDQNNENKILLHNLMKKRFGEYVFDNPVIGKKKWHNTIYVDGEKNNEFIRIFIVSKYFTRHWFRLSVKGKSEKDFKNYCENILNKMNISGL